MLPISFGLFVKNMLDNDPLTISDIVSRDYRRTGYTNKSSNSYFNAELQCGKKKYLPSLCECYGLNSLYIDHYQTNFCILPKLLHHFMMNKALLNFLKEHLITQVISCI